MSSSPSQSASPRRNAAQELGVTNRLPSERARDGRPEPAFHGLDKTSPSPSPNAISINSLPTEILSYCFGLLSDLDSIHAVRLTCNAFCCASSIAFARTFNRRIFHLTHPSLEALKLLANSHDLSPHVHTIHISTIDFVSYAARNFKHLVQNLNNKDLSFVLADQSAAQRYSSLQLAVAAAVISLRQIVTTEIELTQILESSGKLVNSLIIAISRLKRLKHIVLVDGRTLLHVPRCHRPDASQTTAQLAALVLQGEGVLQRLYNLDSHTRAMGYIWTALGFFGRRSTIKSFTTREPVKTNALSCCYRSNPPTVHHMASLYDQPESGDAFALITAIKLDLTFARSGASALVSSSVAVGHCLPRFLHQLPGLTTLSLSFPFPSDQNATGASNSLLGEDFLSELLTPFGAPCVVFRHLETLALRGLRLMNEQALIAFLSEHASTLRHLETKDLQMYEAGSDEWATLLRFIKEDMRLEIHRLLF